MTKPISFTPAKARDYVSAMIEAGLDIAMIEITSVGSMRLYTNESDVKPSTNKEGDEYAKWCNDED